MPEKRDLLKENKEQYSTSRKPHLITLPPVPYLAIVGKGDPNAAEFERKVGGIYTAAFGMKSIFKKQDHDFAVCKLEGLWWGSGDPEADFSIEPPESWNWKLLIRMPEFVGDGDVKEAIKNALAKGKDSSAEEVALEIIEEGQCVQALHIGSYAEEKPTIEAMHAHAQANSLDFHGLHHEIYLSDPRRAAPEKMKTILRHPVKPAS